MKTLADGVVLDLPELDYHSHSALSSTQARALIQSPSEYRDSLTAPRVHSAAFDLGSAVHAKVLGTGWGVVELDFDSYRTKAAQEARDAAYADNLVPMLRKELVQMYAMTESVLKDPDAKILFEQEGNAEASVFATDPATGTAMRARFDYLGVEAGVDLKTTEKPVRPDQFRYAIEDYRYDFQAWWYLRALQIATGETPPFAFVAVCKKRPYTVAVHYLDKDYQRMAEMDGNEALELHAEYTASGYWPKWPGHTGGPNIIRPSERRIYQHQNKWGLNS